MTTGLPLRGTAQVVSMPIWRDSAAVKSHTAVTCSNLLTSTTCFRIPTPLHRAIFSGVPRAFFFREQGPTLGFGCVEHPAALPHRTSATMSAIVEGALNIINTLLGSTDFLQARMDCNRSVRLKQRRLPALEEKFPVTWF